ncbi:putative O-methyltransferase [Xylariomycetidae sp. FL2044]|nr:putative O-methyltransferase [Xylariomycetidae sp. FL2044]
MMMPNSQQSTAIIEKLESLRTRLASGDDPQAKAEALNLSRQLTASLEQPENTAVNLAFAPFISVAARVAVNLGLFNLIANHEGPVNADELASSSGGEALLIVRILRPLASTGFVQEVGERTWEATQLTKAMATNEIAAGHRMVGEMVVGAAMKAPKYFSESGYRCPTDPHDGLMQYAFQTKLTTFELFSSMPQVFKDFNTFMGNTMGARSYWVDWFPVRERLLAGFAPRTPLLVDVGAGKGHDLEAFHRKFPNQEGRLVLQDLASVTDNINESLPRSIESMTYDFFTEQPLKGARVYFYHHILHDWADDKCLRILEQVKAAMTPGYSKLLLHEMIIPEQGASTFHAMLDITMMAFNAGMERSERQWKELLAKAGLEVVKTWLPPQEDADGIVEVVLRQ